MSHDEWLNERGIQPGLPDKIRELALNAKMTPMEAEDVISAVERCAWINTRRQQFRHASALLYKARLEIWCIEGAMDGIQ